jgi:glycosyltransferase involved in cell wall biosynthesis
VCLPGHLPDARQYLGEIDVFVMPSLRQEITSACLEAMAAGVPVILPAADSNRDRADTAAETIPPRDPEALAVALERLLGDSSYRDAVGRRGREFALGHGPPALIRRTLTAYRAVLQRQRNSSL